MCIVCKAPNNAYGSIRSSDIQKDYELTTARRARKHLDFGKKYGIFCDADLNTLIRDNKLCDKHIKQYRNNLAIVEEIARSIDEQFNPVVKEYTKEETIKGRKVLFKYTVYADGSHVFDVVKDNPVGTDLFL